MDILLSQANSFLSTRILIGAIKLSKKRKRSPDISYNIEAVPKEEEKKNLEGLLISSII